MDFFDGFAWAVPKAFSYPLLVSRFEEGDVIYSSSSGYLQWNVALEKTQHSIQVESPSRARAQVTSGFSELFKSNWASPVILNLTEMTSGSTKQITSTQGGLYMTLFSGNLDYIFGVVPVPQSPLPVRELAKKKYGPSISESFPKEDFFHHTFTIWTDITNPVYSEKSLKVDAVLHSQYNATWTDHFPRELGIKDGDRFAPTVFLRHYKLKGEHDHIYQSLKSLLYNPSKDRKSQKDKFKLSRHGILK